MPKFREITGQFVGYVPDGTDPDINPDRETMNGRVTFTPVFTGGVIAFPELSPPEFAHPEPISARIIDGFVQVQVGTDDDVSMQPLSLMVTVDDEASQVWSWRAEFTNMRIGHGEVEITIPAWSFRVPDGTGPVDLTELVPLKTSGTVDVTKGPRGAGLQNITAIDGQLVFEYTDGEETTVPIPEAVQGPQGEPGPAGADGEQGPEGPQGPAGEIPDLLVGNISDATPTGKNLMLAATEGAARNALGLQAGATAANGSLEELSTGTSNTARVWTARNLADYTAGKAQELVDLAKTVVNVMDYGVSADGITDDTANVQSWLNALGPGSVGYMPEGTYRLTSKVTVSKSVSITGNNAEIFLDADGRAIETAESNIDFSIDGISIRGTLNDPSIPATLNYQRGLFLRNSGHIKVTNCKFKNIHNTCIVISNPLSWVISNCIFDTYGYCGASIQTRQRGGIFTNNICIGTGIYPSFDVNTYACAVTHSTSTAKSNKTIISNNIVINQAWEALDTHGGNNIIFSSNILYGVEVGIAAVELANSVDSTPTNIMIEGNVIDSAGYPSPRQAIGIAGATAEGTTVKTTGIISNNIIKGYGNLGNYQYIATAIYARRSSGVNISGNYIEDVYGSAIRLDWCTGYLVSGNNVSGIRPESTVESNKKRFLTVSGDTTGHVFNNVVQESSYTPVYRNVLLVSGVTDIKGANNGWDALPTITPS